MSQGVVADREAFMELQNKVVETTVELGKVRNRMNNAERDKRRAQITLTELKDLPDGTNTYKTVGKMFMFRDIATLRAELTATVDKCNSDLAMLAKTFAYLQNKIKTLEQQLKELIKPAK